MIADETRKHYKTGFVAGSFDLFHIGHLNLIRRAKERCDYLIAGVLPDDVIFVRKGKYPVIPLAERMAIIEAIRYVDQVEAVPIEHTPRVKAQQRYKFDAFFTGDDYLHPGSAEEQRKLNELGADLVFFPYTKEVSSTELRAKILPPAKKDAARPAKTEGFRYVFPFDKVERGERVVIYGTGDVAEQYYNQLKALQFCKIAAFTETYCETEGELKDCKLIPPERLTDTTWYDRVVIASTRYFNEISQKLRAIGLPPERVV